MGGEHPQIKNTKTDGKGCSVQTDITLSPHEKNVKVSRGQIEALVVCGGEAEAHREDGEGEREETPEDEEDGPHPEAENHMMPNEMRHMGK